MQNRKTAKCLAGLRTGGGRWGVGSKGQGVQWVMKIKRKAGVWSGRVLSAMTRDLEVFSSEVQ